VPGPAAHLRIEPMTGAHVHVRLMISAIAQYDPTVGSVSSSLAAISSAARTPLWRPALPRRGAGPDPGSSSPPASSSTPDRV